MSKKRALRYEQLKSEKGITWSRQYIGGSRKPGQFRHHFYVGPQTIAWLESEIDTWLDERIAESRSAASAPSPATRTRRATCCRR